MAAKTKPVKLPRKSRKWTWPVVGLGLGLTLAGFGWRAVRQAKLSTAATPVRPDLAASLPELIDLIARAEHGAQGYWRPTRNLIELSRLYHANGYYAEALQCYEGLRQLEPKEARWPHLQACILAEFGRLQEALPPRLQSVALAPDYLPARLRLGDIYLKANQSTEANQVYAEVIRRDPENAYGLLGLARCAIIRDDWKQADELLARDVQLHPTFYGSATLWVTVKEHFGDQGGADALRASLGRQEFVDLADPWLDGLAEDCYDPYRVSVLAAMAASGGDSERARHLLERSVALAPNVGSYRRQLGHALTEAGDLAGARVQLEKAVAIAADDADSWLQLFQVLKDSGQPGAAQETLAAGLSACPLSPSLHLERARLLSAAGRPVEAIAEFRESYRLRPSETAPLVELAGVLFKTNQAEEALAVLHEGLRKQPEQPMILATLALYSITLGDESGARSWWSQVRRQSRTPPPVVETIKRAFQKQFGQSLN